MRRASLVALLLVAACAVPLAAQDAADLPWPWDAGHAWHVARQWRMQGTDGDSATDAAALRAARAELVLGQPTRAAAILAAHAITDSVYGPPALALAAAAARASGHAAHAARLYLAAAAATGGPTRGFLEARAAGAFEEAGADSAAASAYLAAADALPAIAGWLDIRAARVVADPLQAAELLGAAPRAAFPLAQEVRARLWLASGDSALAIDALAGAGRPAQAARLALGRADTDRALALLATALGGTDTAEARDGLALIAHELPPTNAALAVAAARAAATLGRYEDAARWGARAEMMGDSTPATLVLRGDWLQRAGNERGALWLYARAARGQGRAAVDAELRHARLRARLGERTEAIRELTTFATRHPDHPMAPYALYVAADLRGADSLFAALERRYPASDYASLARMARARGALERRDTAAAVVEYTAERDANGTNALAARFRLAQIAQARGDTASRARLLAIARDDSLGYYGMLARKALGLDPPVFDAPAGRTRVPNVRAALDELDALAAAGLDREAQLATSALVARSWDSVDALLDLADGLIARGRTVDGIALGWRAARRRSLNDARVLRAIFPWPDRTLIVEEAQNFGLDPYLLAAVIRQESSFRADAQSRAGAIGLMQLMPATARGVARNLGVDWDPGLPQIADANLHLGAAHLAELLRRFDGEIVPAVAAYNAGGGAVSRWLRVMSKATRDDDVRFVDAIPYVETRGYVRTVLRNRDLYRALYPTAVDAATDDATR